jgi:hypothetical protein
MTRAFRKVLRTRSSRTISRPILSLEPLEDRSVPTLLGQQLFPTDNPWNQSITGAPVAANSAAVMSNIVTLFGDGRLHPDFGQDYRNTNDLYGIPVNVVHGNATSTTSVVIDDYASESDVIPAPIPTNAVLEGDYQNGPKAGLANRGDSHLIVFDVDNDVAYEFFDASRPGENADSKWHAAQESVWDMKTNSFRTLGWTSADAAGLSVLAGLVRPDEALPVSQGGQGVINHAIRFTLNSNVVLDKFVYPASHTADPGHNNAALQLPMGARLRLKAGVDISQLNPESKIIAQAMKDYGLILADNGSNFFFSGASYSVDANNQYTMTWDDNDIQDFTHGLKSLHFSDFEVVDLTPVVTDLSVHTGSAGASVTITGRNFSGAAGHITVLFGGAAATNVTVVDDQHITATAPAGAGTVDVRVQSGVDAPGYKNVNDPIFGYGISAVSVSDTFTYGGGGTGNNWQFVGGNWTQSGGSLSQTSNAAADPRKALLIGTSFASDVEVSARVRVDSWTDGDYARAGVGLYTDVISGMGYNLVFHGGHGAAGTVQFLDDGVRWGNAYSFSWNVGTWYDFRLKMDHGALYGKVWQDGTAEPAVWQFTQAGWTNRVGGAPSLNGGSAMSSSAGGDSTDSFDSVVARSLPAGPSGLTATAASSSQINLNWNAVAAATSYKVYRSADGASAWTQVGSATTTTYSDTGLAANTTYYYRVAATTAPGDTAFSAVASARTNTGSALFSDDFSGSSFNPAWRFAGGSWALNSGALSQSSTAAADPRKAIVTGLNAPADVEVVARVRVDSWTDGDYARAGVGLYTNETTGAGYNLVFHGGHGAAGTVQFLDDGVRWGNSYSFNWAPGMWYVFKLRMQGGVLYGKIWPDGTPEPTAWQFTQSGWAGRSGGAPSLNGGSSSGSGGNSTVSFDDVVVNAV